VRTGVRAVRMISHWKERVQNSELVQFSLVYVLSRCGHIQFIHTQPATSAPRRCLSVTEVALNQAGVRRHRSVSLFRDPTSKTKRFRAVVA